MASGLIISGENIAYLRMDLHIAYVGAVWEPDMSCEVEVRARTKVGRARCIREFNQTGHKG
jgi:hypothetical protein